MIRKNLRVFALTAALTCVASGVYSQNPRTAYFLDNSPLANTMNPAFIPERGFVLIPNAGVSYISNGAGFGKFAFKNNGEYVSFRDKSVNSQKFLNDLPDISRAHFNANVNFFTVGTHIGKGFGTIGLGVRMNIDMQAPKSLFEFILHEEIDNTNAHIKDMRLLAEGYAELALGYSQPINDKLTIGGKLKVLIGGANADFTINELYAKSTSLTHWDVRAKASFKGSMKGFKFEKNDNDEISGVDFDFDSPFSGFGLGVDFGAVYKISENLKVSASVLDLGFISWGKGSTKIAKAEGSTADYEFEFSDDLLDDLVDLVKLQEEAASGRTTALKATVNLGGEYTFNELVSAGLVMSTYFYQPKPVAELTLIGNLRPASWFSCAASVSMFHSKLSTIGLAVNFHAPGVNFLLGSDYVFFNPRFKNSASAYFGLAITLNKKKY